jgi:hypothetical protein
MTKEYIEQILADMDIQRGSKLWAEYQRGKIVVEAMLVKDGYTSYEWGMAMKIIAEYVGV